jgi:hypothetical protein
VNRIKLISIVILLSSLIGFAEANEYERIETGSVSVTSTGTVTKDLGFRPDYIEFVTAQQIESNNFVESDPTNNDCHHNTNGWSEGSALFDASGVDKQFSIGSFRNSDSTNGHQVASSTSDVVKNIYTNQNGYQCGKLEASVVVPTDNGFKLDIESKYSHYDEIIRYKAYQFPDNLDFDAGMVRITSSGSIDVNSLGFQPANLHIRAAQQVSDTDLDQRYWRGPAGRSKGYATLDENGNVIDQQSIGTASSSDSTNAHRSLATDQHVLNTVYVDQNANVQGRLEGRITGADSNGFTMDIQEKSYSSDEIFLYRAWGQSYYNFTIGHRVIGSQGSQDFDIGFEPDAIDIYAEQQISSINNEVVTPGNSGCSNAGGWSNGFYLTNESEQWSIFTGRSSDSQNAHRYGSSTTYALRNAYSGQNGNDCGNFYGEVTGTSASGFTMDFDYDNSFESNYGQEMVYFRAFNFPLSPPEISDIKIINASNGHSFRVESNITEGANDIDSCDVTVGDGSGNQEVYSGDISLIDSGRTKCTYRWINLTDNPDWESNHNNNGVLPEMDVTVKATGKDGLNDDDTVSQKFPNHEPKVTGFLFSNYTSFHGFKATAVLEDFDSNSSNELDRCWFNVSDGEGNHVYKDSNINFNYGGSNKASCVFQNINSSMPYPSDWDNGFEVLEELNVAVNVTDRHGRAHLNDSEKLIPNTPPQVVSAEPAGAQVVTSFPVTMDATISDPEGDGSVEPLEASIMNESGAQVAYRDDMMSGDVIQAEQRSSEDPGDRYEWTVRTEDKWSSKSYTFVFLEVIGAPYRSGIGLDLNYSSIILNAGDEEYTDLTISNSADASKDITVNLTGVEAEFLDGSTVKDFPNFEPQSQESFTIRITPEEATNKDLTVVVRNNNIGITTEKTVPVTTLRNAQTSREVPGLSIIHLLALLSAATVLYSVRL